jgi:glycosyltransferase 2 family protein
MRQFLLIATKITISAALLYFVVSRMNFSMIEERLSRLEPGWIALAIAIALLQNVVGAIRWRSIVNASGHALATPQAMRFNLIAAFFNQVLPSTVGGDAARIWFVARIGAGWKTATYSVLIDRFIGVLALAVMVATGLYWSFLLIENPVGRLVLLAIGIGSIAGGGAFLAFGTSRLFERWRLTRHLWQIAALARSVLFSRSIGPMIVTLSLLVHVMTAAIAWSLARSMAAPLEFLHAFVLVLPVMLVATVPISIAGWGVRESALVLAFAYAGLPESDGLIVSVLLGGVMFAVGVIGGMIWLASPGGPRNPAMWKPQLPPP